jgi:hypothetical protein
VVLLRLRLKSIKTSPSISATPQIGPTTAPAIAAPVNPLLEEGTGDIVGDGD